MKNHKITWTRICSSKKARIVKQCLHEEYRRRLMKVCYSLVLLHTRTPIIMFRGRNADPFNRKWWDTFRRMGSLRIKVSERRERKVNSLRTQKKSLINNFYWLFLSLKHTGNYEIGNIKRAMLKNPTTTPKMSSLRKSWEILESSSTRASSVLYRPPNSTTGPIKSPRWGLGCRTLKESRILMFLTNKT